MQVATILEKRKIRARPAVPDTNAGLRPTLSSVPEKDGEEGEKEEAGKEDDGKQAGG